MDPKILTLVIGSRIDLTNAEREAYHASKRDTLKDMVGKPFTMGEQELGTITEAFLNWANALTIRVACTDEGHEILSRIAEPYPITFSINVG